MARFATFIADPDLELLAIKAISAIQGEVFIRGVTADQISKLPSDVSIITNCNTSFQINNSLTRISPDMDLQYLINLIAPKSELKKVSFQKGNSKVVGFLGLSGGAGTTSIAINYAFELAKQSSVTLLDLNEIYPEIALNLNLRRIEGQIARVGSNLEICQGIPDQIGGSNYSEIVVLDLGTNFDHELIPVVDTLFVTSRLSKNSIFRLANLPCVPTALICNFSERSKYQELWLREVKDKYPLIKILMIPYDQKAFELAAEKRSALLEVAPNSLARKHIATLI